uniref:Reverse transcriptase Ty1/copia-type domain-containing protein n=1 Tax=Cannabis sativa TaxID=3483 RepID=A0A803PSU2_CANSA
MMAKAAKFSLEVDQMDVGTNFLHGELEKKVYMEIPKECDKEYAGQVCLLKKSLYGLKQAPSDHIYLLLYVDDILIIGKQRSKLNDLKMKLNEEFKMKDLRKAKGILGIDIHIPTQTCITQSQSSYLQKVLDKFGMDTCKPVATPIAQYFKLSASQSPNDETVRIKMTRIPYASYLGVLYTPWCAPDLI